MTYTYELWYTDENNNEYLIGCYSTENQAWEAAIKDARITDYSFYQVIKRYL